MKLSNATLLLLTGALVGGLAALLLAPDEGVKTRKKLLKKAKRFKKKFGEKTEEYKERASDIKDDIQGAASDFKKRFS